MLRTSSINHHRDRPTASGNRLQILLQHRGPVHWRQQESTRGPARGRGHWRVFRCRP